MASIDPIMARFRMALNEVYGDKIERVTLFGSRARGDARPDSDYDVAVFLKDLADRWAEADKIANIATDIMDVTGVFIHAMPYRAAAYHECTPLMHEVRREGRDLWLWPLAEVAASTKWRPSLGASAQNFVLHR